MKLQKICITSSSGHFGEVLGRDNRNTINLPPPSTIIGMLKVIYDNDIDDFVFGYLFSSLGKYKDDTTLYKATNKGYLRKKGIITTDCKYVEYHTDCKLIIYTNIGKDIKINYPICMGKSGNLARVHLPIKDIVLIEKEGQGFNQFTPKNIGKGVIKPTNLVTKYNPILDAYDHQVAHLRLNKIFDYGRNYDIEEEQSIFLWHCKDGEVKAYD